MLIFTSDCISSNGWQQEPSCSTTTNGLPYKGWSSTNCSSQNNYQGWCFLGRMVSLILSMCLSYFNSDLIFLNIYISEIFFWIFFWIFFVLFAVVLDYVAVVPWIVASDWISYNWIYRYLLVLIVFHYYIFPAFLLLILYFT